MRWLALRCALGTLYTSFAPAGDPPSQGSGTLMSLLEGIAAPRSHSCGKPFHTEPAGRRIDFLYGTTTAPKYLSCSLASCLRYLTPVFPSPPPRTLFPSRGAAVHSPPRNPHPTSHQREGDGISRGEAGMFRRDIRVSDAKRGRVPCRSKEHTASTRQKIKPRTNKVRGLWSG